MSGILVVFALAGVALILSQNWSHHSDVLPAFVREYKKSNTYWISAFVGAIYGSLEITILEEWRIIAILLVFVGPIIIHYTIYKPFGLDCEYTPITDDYNLIDSLKRKNQTAKMTEGECEIPLNIHAGKHLTEYKIKFEAPNDTEIRFVDHYSDKIQEYDEKRDVMSIKGVGEDQVAVLVYVEEDHFDPRGAEPFRIREYDTEQILLEVDIVK